MEETPIPFEEAWRLDTLRDIYEQAARIRAQQAQSTPAA